MISSTIYRPRDIMLLPLSLAGSTDQVIASRAAGNWANWRGFSWEKNKPADADNWCVLPLSYKGAPLLEQANLQAMVETLQDYSDRQDVVRFFRITHPEADIYVVAVRVFFNRQSGVITAGFRLAAKALRSMFDGQPIDDAIVGEVWDRLVSDRIREIGKPYALSGLLEHDRRLSSGSRELGWPTRVLRWLEHQRPAAVVYDGPASPIPALTEDLVCTAMMELRILDERKLKKEPVQQTIGDTTDLSTIEIDDAAIDNMCAGVRP